MTTKNSITCQECTAELEIKVLNDEDLNSSELKYCPCCGRKTELAVDGEEPFDAEMYDWDDLQETTNF